MTVVMSHLPCDSGQQSSVAGLYLFQESLLNAERPWQTQFCIFVAGMTQRLVRAHISCIPLTAINFRAYLLQSGTK